jgi:hypothetical protein
MLNAFPYFDAMWKVLSVGYNEIYTYYFFTFVSTDTRTSYLGSSDWN